MFIGEAPGRLGADSSLIPFHGDSAGRNFEALIEQAGIDRYETFVTNAVLCNPKDEKGNNSTPTKEEIANCAPFLRRQIDIVSPELVVTLGATALRATQILESHNLDLASSTRRSYAWYRRRIIPAYHPGQRAMLHRSFVDQLADYRFISEQAKPHGNANRPPRGPSDLKIAAAVNVITSLQPRLSYFALHKLLFLSEVRALRETGRRITAGYVVRQKDGPYFVDLHPARIRKSLPFLQIESKDNKLVLSRTAADLFDVPSDLNNEHLSPAEQRLIADVIKQCGGLSDAELKRRAYLTTEMRKILKLERARHLSMLNAPLLVP